MNYVEELSRLAELLHREKKAELEELQKVLKTKSIHERKSMGRCLYPLTLEDTSYSIGGKLEFKFKVENVEEITGFSTGSMVSVFSSSDSIKSTQLITATIKSVKGKELLLVSGNEEEPDELWDAKIGVDLALDDRTYRVMEHTLNYLINTDEHEKKQVLKNLWSSSQVKGLSVETHYSNPNLNEWQNQAVNQTMITEDFLGIHGPPGTGKTTTLVQAVKQAVKSEGKTLVTANSNAAVDHLVKCMIKEGLNVVRIGNLAKVDEEVATAQIEVKMQSDSDYKFIQDLKKRATDARKKAEKFKRTFNQEDRENRKRWYQESRELRKEIKKTESYLIEKTIHSADVVAATLIGSDSEILREFSFKTAFIDEAAQALIPAALTPFKRAEKLVLAGDPFQLPPLVKDNHAAKDGLEKSLLEILMENAPERTVMLKTQYRMDELIMNFSNTQFYNGELIAHESVASHGFSQDGFLPLEFIDTAGADYDEESSKSGFSHKNSKEAELVVKRIEELSPFLEEMSLGVISPYRGQVNYLKELLPNYGADVNTVDAFQGQERDIIVVSLVRANEEMIIGFLKDYRRMNVAMTRARKRLILIGNSATIGGDKFYGDFLEFVEANGSYRSAWEYV